jgi:glucose-1-phosphate adenylyltransferase
MLVAYGSAQVYDVTANQIPGAEPTAAAYWRDVGTLDADYDAHIGLCAADPAFDLDSVQWPILTHVPSWPPAKFMCEPAGRARHSTAWSAMASSCPVAWSASLCCHPVSRSAAGATVQRSVVPHNTAIGRGAVVRNAIIDKNVVVADGAQIGCDKEHDRARGFAVTEAGLTVVGKGQHVPC